MVVVGCGTIPPLMLLPGGCGLRYCGGVVLLHLPLPLLIVPVIPPVVVLLVAVLPLLDRRYVPLHMRRQLPSVLVARCSARVGRKRSLPRTSCF